MADKKISELDALTGANTADDDRLVIVDTSAGLTKSITMAEFKNAFDSGSGFVRVTGDTMTGDLALSGADVTFGDSDKAIFGAGSDLQIYSNGTNSFISESNVTGSLFINASNLVLRNTSGEYYLYGNSDGAVNLYHDNATKLATTSTGIDVTGTVTADGLTVGGNLLRDVDNNSIFISGGNTAATGANIGLYGSTSGNPNDILLRRNNVKFAAFDGATGDISFYEDTGTTPKFFWDASAETLRLGEYNSAGTPSGSLFVDSNANNHAIHIEETGGGSESWQIGVDTDGDLGFYNSQSTTASVTFDDSGNVGIGTASPNFTLQLDSQRADATFDANDLDTWADFKIQGQTSSGNARGIYFDFDSDTGNDKGAGIVGISGDGTGGVGSLGFITTAGNASAERMRITSSGSVGIGSSTIYGDGGSTLSLSDDLGGNVGGRLALHYTGNSGYAQISTSNANDVVIDADRTNAGSNTNIQFRIDNTEHMRISSSGSVGIGTSSPTSKLHLQSTNSSVLKLETTSANTYPGINFINDAQRYDMQIDGATDAFRIYDNTSSATRFVLDTSGNVGIGTTPHSNSKLHILDTTSSLDDYTVHLEGYATAVVWQDISGGPSTDFAVQVDGSAMMFRYGDASTETQLATEAMRLDSSGRLLLGTSTVALYASTSGGETGTVMSGSGDIYNARDGATNLILNRLTSDGDILNFRKDGSTVGSIGVDNSDNLFIQGNSTHVGFQFASSAVVPHKNGATIDNNVNLGSASDRFKDLHLSGGVEIENGSGNVGVGKQALNSNTASNNTAVGYQAAYSNTTGASITAVGHSALYSNTTGNYNTALGLFAGYDNTTGGQNTAIGYDALANNTTASNNTAVGYQALYDNTTGSGLVALGNRSLYENATGTSNVASGSSSLRNNTSGNYNSAFGDSALRGNTTANENTAVGYQAGYSNTTSSFSTFIGKAAGYNSTGAQSTYVGEQSGYYITSGAKNTILGRYNGNQGGLDIRTSSNNIVLSDGDGNPRLYTNDAGTSFFGTTTDGNPSLNPSVISVGPVASQNGIKVHTNSTANYVAYGGKGGNTSWYYGHMVNPSNTTIGTIQCSASSVSYNTSSDHRLKENVVELTGATDRLKQLNPSRFNFIADADTTVDGFIAHEVQTVVPEAITGTHNEVDDDGNPVYQGIDQSKLVPLLVATIQELEARITALENA